MHSTSREASTLTSSYDGQFAMEDMMIWFEAVFNRINPHMVDVNTPSTH